MNWLDIIIIVMIVVPAVIGLKVGLINHTIVAPAEFLAMACREFKLQVNGGGKVRCLELIENFLLKQRSSGKRVTLIIDEAQNLSMETLEEIRMLSNLETEKHSLIQIILVGQPELKNKLQHKSLIQLTQRVTVSYHLGALAPDEVSTYIHRRLQASGRKGTSLFHPEAMEMIGGYSQGVPRIINIVCDSALVLGFSDRAHVINKRIIEDVIKVRESGSIFGGSAVSTPIQGSPQSEPSSLAKSASPLDNQVQLMVNELSSIKAALERIESHLSRIVRLRSSRS